MKTIFTLLKHLLKAALTAVLDQGTATPQMAAGLPVLTAVDDKFTFPSIYKDPGFQALLSLRALEPAIVFSYSSQVLLPDKLLPDRHRIRGQSRQWLIYYDDD